MAPARSQSETLEPLKGLDLEASRVACRGGVGAGGGGGGGVVCACVCGCVAEAIWRGPLMTLASESRADKSDARHW